MLERTEMGNDRQRPDFGLATIQHYRTEREGIKPTRNEHVIEATFEDGDNGANPLGDISNTQEAEVIDLVPIRPIERARAASDRRIKKAVAQVVERAIDEFFDKLSGRD